MIHRRSFAAAALAAALAFVPGQTRADESRLSRLTALGDDAIRAPDAESYAAMRRIWGEWERGDPNMVEEELEAVARARRGSTRVYAELLAAYGRRRLGDLDGARTRVAALGFVSKWLVVGPFDNEGKSGLLRLYEPETEPSPLGSKLYDGKERKVQWRSASVAAPFGWIDTGSMVRPSENVCVFATTYVSDPRLAKGASREASLWVGSSGSVRVYWNGQLALDDRKYRDFDAERMGRSVTLAAGPNRVLVKACGSDNAPIFTLRVAAADGSPDSHIVADASFAYDESRALFQKQKLPPNRVAGPVQTFDGVEKNGSPAALEAYARYLLLTQSDDEADHLARDLAIRAAQRAPTVRRALLAASLVESRNQRAEWIAKAEALVTKGGVPADQRMEVLLARAAHERAGTNWRDAIPYYDRALALDPDDVQAVLARVELYGEANLRATSIAFLQRALARNPRSLALVRAMVDLLRQEDRTSEADDMEARYAAYRFDDPELLKSKIDLAIAQRDGVAARHWLDRYIATDPDATDKLLYAAQTELKLGDTPHAIALYKRTLEIAPEDTDAMQKLADAYGLSGQQNDQVTLLRHILELKPAEQRRPRLPRAPRADQAATGRDLRDRAEGVPRAAQVTGARRRPSHASST